MDMRFKTWVISVIVFAVIILDGTFNKYISITLSIFTPIGIILAISYMWFLDHKMLIGRIREITGEIQNGKADE